jgi:hypothetical protein
LELTFPTQFSHDLRALLALHGFFRLEVFPQQKRLVEEEITLDH